MRVPHALRPAGGLEAGQREQRDVVGERHAPLQPERRRRRRSLRFRGERQGIARQSAPRLDRCPRTSRPRRTEPPCPGSCPPRGEAGTWISAPSRIAPRAALSTASRFPVRATARLQRRADQDGSTGGTRPSTGCRHHPVTGTLAEPGRRRPSAVP